jgi:predicted dienelactone hydrolase
MKHTFIKYTKISLVFLLVQLANPYTSFAQVSDLQFITGDALPDAPELAARGAFKIGVRTLEVVHSDQVDILKSKDGIDPLYDRKLRLEVWYPALVPDGTSDLIEYEESRGIPNDPKRPFIKYAFSGRALRDAKPDFSSAPFPLVIVSHGYVGSRLLMTYLTENIASKGYIVVSIDHMESTYMDAAGFQSTLLNRSRDILFVLDQVAEMSKASGSGFLSGMVDVNNIALVGYSMGGYGVLNAAGAGYSPRFLTLFSAMSGGSKALEVLTTDNAQYKGLYDSRIKAVIAMAPWGMERGAWDSTGLRGLKVPTFFIAGSMDDVSGYEKGTKAIFNGAINSDRYLLTYVNARHNIAPNPPPLESLKPGLPFDFYYHYAEPAWDQRRINNINQHFITAFLGMQLKNIYYDKYLEISEDNDLRTWPGFKNRTSVGLELLHILPEMQ